MAPKRKKAVRGRRNAQRKKQTDKNKELKKAEKRSASGSGNNNDDDDIPKPKHCKGGVQILPTPVKALADPNTYKLIKLSNGIRALLIHKPTTSEPPRFCSNNQKKGKLLSKFLPPGPPFPSNFPSERNGFNNFQKATSSLTTDFGVFQSRYTFPQAMPNHVARFKEIDEGKTASLAVLVNVGSTADFEYRSGLAHFCEHLVHYGSKKFPGEESHIKYVMNKGDDFNACTTPMATGYYHTANEAFVEEGCERMAEMMANPVFNLNMIKKEVQSLDNEFFLNFHQDILSIVLIIWSFAKKDHPIRMFHYGNLKTLLPEGDGTANIGVENLREDLVNFHQRYYKGTAMTLAIQSNQSIQFLEKMVVEHFETIPKGDKCIRREMKIPNCHKDPFNTKEFNRFYFVNGKQSSPYLAISWSLPPDGWQDFRRKPFDFWGSLIGDERESGLAYQLQKEGLISDMGASVDDSDYNKNEYCTILEIRIVFSCPWFFDEKGTLVSKIEMLLERIFQYIGRLRNMSQQQKTILWSEFASKNLSFDYSIPTEGAEFTQACASALQIMPESEIFTAANKVIPEYEHEAMSRYLNMLTIRNMNVLAIVPSKTLRKYSAELKGFKEGYEKHTETTYWGKEFSKKLLTRLGCHLKNGKPALIFPINPFYTRIDARLSELSCVHVVPPILLENNGKCNVQHNGNDGDDWFLAECFVNIHSSAALFRFHHTNLCKLLLLKACLSRIVLPISCAAEKSGMQVAIQESGGSLKFQFIGFAEKLDLFVGEILRCVFPPEGHEGFPRHIFDVAKADLVNKVTDYLGTGGSLISSLFEELMTLGCPSFRNTITTLSNITYERFLCFTKLHSNSSFIEARMEGNIALKTCEKIATIINGLNYFPKIKGWQNALEFLSPETRMFPYDPRCVRVKSEHRKEKNSIVANCYQFVGSANVPSVIDFLVLYMRAPYFTIMRIDAQLGYALSINIGQLRFPFISASVVFPAHKKTLCEVDSAIDMFFVQFEERYLSILTEAEFQEQKLLWSLSETLTLEQVKKFYRKTFMMHMQPLGPCDGPLEWCHAPGKIRKFSIQVLGKSFERCKGTYAQCDRSRWTKPANERNQPISFAADENDTAFPYFIKDPQWFRDGGNR